MIATIAAGVGYGLLGLLALLLLFFTFLGAAIMFEIFFGE